MLEICMEKTFSHRQTSFSLNIDFKLDAAGKCIVFFGPSGSGKTLTMNCIAGLVRPDRGRIIFNERIFFDSAQKINVPARKRHIGYMFQDYALFPHLNILQNVAYPRSGLWGRRLNRQETERAMELLKTLGIAHLARHVPEELSGGQKQRAALARALNSSPGMLLLDEPFSALDPLLREQLRKDILGFLRKFSIPSIIITHDPADVETFCGTLVLYEYGRATIVEDYASQRRTFSSTTQCLRQLQENFCQKAHK